MKKLLSLVLSFALVCTLISGCGPKGGGGNSSNQPLDAAETTFGLTPLPERTTLTIGFFSGSAHSMPWYIADRMGFFDELNIDVEYESFIGGPAMMEASASWDICDVGAPGILNGMKNYDIQMLGLCDNEYNTALFVRTALRPPILPILKYGKGLSAFCPPVRPCSTCSSAIFSHWDFPRMT